jgi:hypothetical protein
MNEIFCQLNCLNIYYFDQNQISNKFFVKCKHQLGFVIKLPLICHLFFDIYDKFNRWIEASKIEKT